MTKIFGTLGKLTGIFVDAFRYISNEKFLATFTTNNDQIREPTYLRTCQDNDRFGRRKAKNRHPQKAGTGFFLVGLAHEADVGAGGEAQGYGHERSSSVVCPMRTGMFMGSSTAP